MSILRMQESGFSQSVGARLALPLLSSIVIPMKIGIHVFLRKGEASLAPTSSVKNHPQFRKEINMKNVWNFISRNSVWILIGTLALLFFGPGLQEIRTLLLITIIEALALGLSGAAVYAFTKVDFTKGYAVRSLGFIFLGVHLCVGLVVLGVYLAQF